MSALSFRIEWESPGIARGKELRATWARLEILVGDEAVTQVYDTGSKSVRAGIYLPLYPLAEWVVTNWWALLHECQVSGRERSRTYAQRHNMISAAEGFAVPDLELRPLTGSVEFVWRQRHLPLNRVHFTAQGRTILPVADVKDCLQEFVSQVVNRLSDQEVGDTLLQEDWRAINQLDSEQAQFSQVAGMMGLDPFDPPDALAPSLDAIYGQVPAEIEPDFFEAADEPRLLEQADWIATGVTQAQSATINLERLDALRNDLQHGNGYQTPWEQGYKWAREVRERLHLQSKDKLEFEELIAIPQPAIAQHASGKREFDGVAFFDTQSPMGGFVVRAGNVPSQRFNFCRGLFEFLHRRDRTLALLTSAVSDKQQRNRAFAAELLAPSARLASQLSGPLISQSEVEDLAEAFQVSTYVITHQIKNHGLGSVI